MLALTGVVAVAVAGVVTSFVALAATALIVPGTGDPNANVVPGYMENAVSRYLRQTRCFEGGAPNGCDVAVLDPSVDPAANLIGINYPASFWPMPFPGWCEPGRCEKWNVSVGEGVSGLNAEIIRQWSENPNEDLVVFGYSQGGAVVSNELRNLDQLPDEIKDRLQVVMIGNIANPDGGLWQRLAPVSFLGELLLDATFGPPMMTDSGIPITNIGFEYDPVVYAPRYWGNPLTMLNAIAAFDNVHGYYLAPNGGDPDGTMPYGYTEAQLAAALADPDNIRYGGNNPNSANKYIMIPATSLPLANLILSLAESTGTTAIVKPFVDLLAPAAKVIIDLGYDWSGDPDKPVPLSLLPFNPFNNWLEVGEDLVVALGEGVHNVFGGPTVAPLGEEPAEAGVDAASEPQLLSPAAERAKATEPAGTALEVVPGAGIPSAAEPPAPTVAGSSAPGAAATTLQDAEPVGEADLVTEPEARAGAKADLEAKPTRSLRPGAALDVRKAAKGLRNAVQNVFQKGAREDGKKGPGSRLKSGPAEATERERATAADAAEGKTPEKGDNDSADTKAAVKKAKNDAKAA
ncbi:PE-PPE domain-containing protein [[Mycobacterium] wendilense]|uniref:PE-PPE domain-containing protein n=1 Tax=[Mycobacterium] wendilense TaxID=3064284 RepID=A0ABN9NUD4_9MYCO|nr:PE-PPE domain-containing protein [Mycolicibacterium sp. MU0050]CAJ1579742.1 PE-PPE domain-containing protein [Mycolicibacterium sp. MU0050]